VAIPESGEMLGVPKAEFLRSVREALGREDVPPAEPYPRLTETQAELEDQAAQIHRKLEENLPALLDKLAEMAALGGWNVHRASGVEEAIGYIESVARDSEATNIVRSAQDVFDQIPVDAVLANLGLKVTTVLRDDETPREALREEIRQSGIGITGADYALAETGSLIVLPRRGLSRLVSLVPPVHIALVRPEDILESRRPVLVAAAGVSSAGRRDGQLPELHHRAQPHRRHRDDHRRRRPRPERSTHGHPGLTQSANPNSFSLAGRRLG